LSGWLIYGATGYTGQLIAREAARQRMTPIVAGRNPVTIEALGKSLGLAARVLVLDDPVAIAAGLDGVTLVLNCAGPFSHTAEQMMQACLARRIHYLDITGEIEVFERAQALDAQALAAGVVVCPGVGFDVIPTDCVAAMLKAALPDANELALGFDGSQQLSPGTAKTAVEHLAEGGKIRRDGKLVAVPFGYGVRRIDFGRGETDAMAIPWGDVATAYYTTGIPNVTVYARASREQLRYAGLFNAFRFVFGWRWVRDLIARRIEARFSGPDEAERALGATWVWGEATDASGATKTIRLKTLEPYALTVVGALGVVRRVLEHPAPAGTTTPARLMGNRYVLDLPGTEVLSG
jgi:short subunit dehydrogenase-like uncharacterized protein